MRYQITISSVFLMEREDSKKSAAGNEVMLIKEGRTIMGVYNVRLE